MANENPSFVEMALPVIFGAGLTYCLFSALKCVLKRARVMSDLEAEEQMEVEEYRKKYIDALEKQGTEETFLQKYGYGYDWVFVFAIHEEPEEDVENFKKNQHELHAKKQEYKANMHRDDDFKKYYSMKTVVDHLIHAGLGVKLFYSTQRDECYCKIQASPMRLEYIADQIDYRLKLNADRTNYCLRKGRPHKNWFGREIIDEKNLCKYGPFEYLYGKFQTNDDEKIVLYQRHKLLFGNDSQFRNIDRIKLITEIFKQKANGNGQYIGCGFDMPRLLEQECLLAYYPLHDKFPKIQLERKWLAINTMPSQQPMEGIKDYFGEKIAMYFGWLGVYTTFLLYACPAGFLTFWVSFGFRSPDCPLTPYMAAFMAIWGTVFLEMWKRQQITFVMEWGMSGFESAETDRAAFKGEQKTPDNRDVTNPVNAEPYIYFSPRKALERKLLSNIITVIFICTVMITVFMVFQLKGLVNQPPYREQFTFGLLGLEVELGALVPSVINGGMIFVFSAGWKVVSLKLNENENHRTDTQFEDALIAKTFSFEFVNKYAACFYAAFFKKYFVEGDPCDPDCFTELSVSLATILLIGLAVKNPMDVAITHFGVMKRQKEESMGVSPDRKMSVVEKEYTAITFDKMLGTFREYQDMAFQFGYATIFSAAFPLAPILTFFANFVEIRVDAWKLLQCTRRPEPSGCEDIGTWYTILDLISTFSVITNGLLVFFVAPRYEDTPWTQRFVLFILFEHILFAAKFLAAEIVPDVPQSTEIQLKRQEFIESKVIDNERDDDADVAKQESVDVGYMIADEDRDPMFDD